MFFGVVVMGIHTWAPIQPGVEEEGPARTEESNDMPMESEPVDDIIACSRKHTPSLGPCGRIRMKQGATFLREQISQLVTSISSTLTSNSVHAPTSVQEAINVLQQLLEVYNDMDFYLFSTRLLEDVMKRKFLMSIPIDRRVPYLHYFYEKEHE